MVIIISHAEVSCVSASFRRRFEFNRPSILFVFTDDLINFLSYKSELIAISLNKLGVFRPGLLSVVSECPLFDKRFITGDSMLVAKIFFDETSRVLDWFLRLANICSTKIFSVHRVKLAYRAWLVLTNNFDWSLLRLSDLKQWILMNFGSLALFTKIVIMANGTHVSNTNDRSNSTAVTDKFLVNNLSLSFLLLSDTVNYHTSELICAVIFDCSFHSIHSCFKEFALETTSAITFLTIFSSFFILFGTVALVAVDLRNLFLEHLLCLRLVHVIKYYLGGKVSNLVFLDGRLINDCDWLLLQAHLRLLLVLLRSNFNMLLFLFLDSLLKGVRVRLHASSLWHHVNLRIKVLRVESLQWIHHNLGGHKTFSN